MRKTACFLVAALFVALSASSYLTIASQIGTRQHDAPASSARANSELNQQQTTSASDQVARYSRVTSNLEAASGAKLEFQLASPRTSARASAPPKSRNTSRIVVSTSKVNNASKISPTPSKGFAFPIWLLLLAAILVLLAGFGLLWFRLIRESDQRPTVEAPSVLVVKPAAPVRAKGPGQTLIEAERTEAERRHSASAITRPRGLRRIPITTKEEEER